MKTRKLLVIMLVILASASITTVSAAIYLNYGSKSPYINVLSYTNAYNDTWVSILDNGRSSWNTSSAKVTVTTTSSSANQIYAAQYADSWYGLATRLQTSGGYITKFKININARTIGNDAINFNNFARNVVAHEFGHIFWLSDNPTTSSASLMRHDRNRNTMVGPQPYDIVNVNAKY